MKKVIIGTAIAIVVVLAAVVAVPIVSVASWKTNTSIELTDMFTVTQENTDTTITFLGKPEPSKTDIGAEIERIQTTKAELAKTAEGLLTIWVRTHLM